MKSWDIVKMIDEWERDRMVKRLREREWECERQNERERALYYSKININYLFKLN